MARIKSIFVFFLLVAVSAKAQTDTVLWFAPPDSVATLSEVVCEENLPYILNGQSYDQAGIYYQHLTDAAGCDSLVVLALTIIPTPELSVTVSDEIPFVRGTVSSLPRRQIPLWSCRSLQLVTYFALTVLLRSLRISSLLARLPWAWSSMWITQARMVGRCI